MLSKDNRDNLGSFHSLWLAKAKSLPNNDFNNELFTKIEFTQNTGQWNKPLRNSVNGSYYEHTLQFIIPKYRAEVESFLLLHIDVPLIAYIKTHNGDLVRIGTQASPFLLSSDFTSGTGAMGFNSYTFSGKATEVLKRNFGVTLPTLPPPNEAIPTVLQNARLILSVRRVKETYLGSCFTLRRDNDNATQNFGFLPNGELDLAAITAFKGTSSLFVRSWYDQSGNNYNFFQIENAKQPQLLLNGNANKAEINFNGSNNFLEIDANIYAGSQARTMFITNEVFLGNGIYFSFNRNLPNLLFINNFPFIYSDGVYQNIIRTDTAIDGNFCFAYLYPGIGQNLRAFINTNELELTENPLINLSFNFNGSYIGKFGSYETYSRGKTQEIICCDNVLGAIELALAQNNTINYFELN